MKIVEINGGLGNQICEYVFSRYLNIIYGYENVLLDDLYHCGFYITHNGFELNLFPNINLNLLSNMFDSDVWNNMIDIYKKSRFKSTVPYIFNNNGIELILVADEYWYDDNGRTKDSFKFEGSYCTVTSDKFHNKNNASHEELKKYENVYFKGIWSTNLYCNDIKKQIEYELKFPPLMYQENIDYCKSISSSEISVGLHIRLGDFIDCSKTVHTNKYSKNLIILKRKLEKTKQPKPNFFIFSDDITWCKENTKDLGFNDEDSITFIEGNDVDARNYIDMQLMTYCDYLIHNFQSTFCLAAQMISEKNITRIPVK